MSEALGRWPNRIGTEKCGIHGRVRTRGKDFGRIGDYEHRMKDRQAVPDDVNPENDIDR